MSLKEKKYQQQFIDRMSQRSVESLLLERDELLLAINQTIGEIAIGYVTNNHKLIELENNNGFEWSFDEFKRINIALKDKGIEMLEIPFVEFDVFIEKALKRS